MCQLALKEALINVQRFDGRYLGRWQLGAGGSQQPRPEVGRGVLAAGEWGKSDQAGAALGGRGAVSD